MKEFILDVLAQFQNGRLTLEEAAARLLTEQEQDGKSKSNRRLKNLCGALRRERNPAKLRVLRLRDEFYRGDPAE
jgi:hypothetical protein